MNPMTFTHTPADDAIHSLGNGQMCVYAQGPQLLQIFGPPYSTPSLSSLLLEQDPGDTVLSQREPGAAVWRHTLRRGGRVIGELTDFVDADLPCLVRCMDLSEPIRLVLRPETRVQLVYNHTRWGENSGGCLLEAPAGTYLYHNYPFPIPIFQQVVWTGNGHADLSQHAQDVVITCGPGECKLFISGGPEYPRAVACAEEILRTPYPVLRERTLRWWQAYSSGRTDWPASLSRDLPQRESLLQAVDDVAVLIKAQQSAEGAVLAGHNYHLGYVRDQYGVSRGLLALGHTAEARAILSFYWCIWQHHGRIHNAQAAGVEGVFHVHENDEVEITGYLIQQAFDLLEKSGDEAFLGTIWPMLEWAWEAQKKHLVGEMLPFNGDETYVAGGILPRHTLNDGSAEATLLFIESGEKLLSWASQTRQWSTDRADENLRVLKNVRSAYHANFWAGGQLLTNNPRRAAILAQDNRLPRCRHGVCEGCLAEGRAKGIEWTERSPSGRYLCPACLELGLLPAAAPQTYRLQSVSLTPFYFKARLFSPQELGPLVETILSGYLSTGQLPSRPDDSGGIAVGYDYGLLLYALISLRHPAGRDLYQKTLSLVDSSGAWVEYYLNHQPRGTRCRPWESAINLEALLGWASQFSSAATRNR